MSPYAKQTWANANPSTPLSAERLNYIEAGIEAAMDAAESAAGANPIALYTWTGSAWSPDPSLGVPAGTLYRHFRGPAPYMGDTIEGVYDEYFPTA